MKPFDATEEGQESLTVKLKFNFWMENSHIRDSDLCEMIMQLLAGSEKTTYLSGLVSSATLLYTKINFIPCLGKYSARGHSSSTFAEFRRIARALQTIALSE